MLTKEFSRHKKAFIRHKVSNTKKQENEKKRKVERFLLYTKKRFRIQRLEELEQKHFDNFLNHLSKQGLSDETVRKYTLAIREFAKNAHLKGIYLNPNKAKKRKVNKRLKKVGEILKKYNCDEEIFREIEEVLNI